MVDSGNLISQPAPAPKIHSPIWSRTSFETRRMRNFNNPRILESLKRPRRMQSEFCGLTQFGTTAVPMKRSGRRLEDLQLYEIYA